MLAHGPRSDGRGGGSRATARTSVPGWLLMGGTSTSWPVSVRLVLVLPVFVVGVERAGWAGGGLTRCWVLRERALVSVRLVPGLVWVSAAGWGVFSLGSSPRRTVSVSC